MVFVDFEGTCVHTNGDMILVSRVGWYSPRVPAGEASAILEFADVDLLPVLCGDRELGRTRPIALDAEVAADLAAGADQTQAEGDRAHAGPHGRSLDRR